MTELRSFSRPPTGPLVFKTGAHVYTADETSMVTPVYVNRNRFFPHGMPVSGPPADDTKEAVYQLKKQFRANGKLDAAVLEAVTPEMVAVMLHEVEAAKTWKRWWKPALTAVGVGAPTLLAAGMLTGVIGGKESGTKSWMPTIAAALLAAAVGGGVAWYATRPPIKLLTYLKKQRSQVVAEGLAIFDGEST